MRIQNRTTLLVYFVILFGATAPAFMTADQLFVAAPGFACVLMVFWLWMALWNRDHKIPFFDVGIFCALATLVYTVYPLVNYWADGFQFGILSDNRLRVYNPDPYRDVPIPFATRIVSFFVCSCLRTVPGQRSS